MKKLLFVMLISFHYAAFAQVGIGTDTPHSSAILDVSATDKGIIFPKMSSAQRIAIASPAAGLHVYDTGTNSLWYYTGTTWIDIQAVIPKATQAQAVAGTSNDVFMTPLRTKEAIDNKAIALGYEEIIRTSSFTLSSGTADIISFTLPLAGTYMVMYILEVGQSSSNVNDNFDFQVRRGTDAVVVPGLSTNIYITINANSKHNVVQSSFVSVSGSTNYILSAKRNDGSMDIASGKAKVIYLKIG